MLIDYSANESNNVPCIVDDVKLYKFWATLFALAGVIRKNFTFWKSFASILLPRIEYHV